MGGIPPAVGIGVGQAMPTVAPTVCSPVGGSTTSCPLSSNNRCTTWGLGLGCGTRRRKRPRTPKRMCSLLKGINCPTRRQSILYPYVKSWPDYNSVMPTNVSRSDYAANGGTAYLELPNITTIAEGEARRKDFADLAKKATGVMFSGSQIKPADVTDGASNTYLLGEKYLEPDSYDTGTDTGDNEAALIGDDHDITRWASEAPCLDTPNVYPNQCFGSAHSNGFNMAFCDGSVQTMSYVIDMETHRCLCNRGDGKPVDPKKLQ